MAEAKPVPSEPTETPKEEPVEPVKTDEKPKLEDDPEWQARIDKIAQSREDRVRTQYSKQVKDLQKEIEMMKKEKMSENERREYEAQQLKEALETKERDLTRREMELLSVKKLEEKQLPVSFVEFVIGENEETTLKNIESMEKVFGEAVKSAVDVKMKAYGREPHKGRTGDTNSQFEGMTPTQIEQKARNDPEWWRKNEDAIMEFYKGGYKK